MLEPKREDALVGLVRRDLPQGARDLGIGDLAPRPELRQPAAFGGAGERQRHDPRLVADHALDLERAGERAHLGGKRQRLAGGLHDEGEIAGGVADRSERGRSECRVADKIAAHGVERIQLADVGSDRSRDGVLEV